MKILIVCLFTGIFVGTYIPAFAQTKNDVIAGKIITNTHYSNDVASAILLSAADSSILKSTSCDSLGSFKFQHVQPGKYLILATKLGYTQLISGPYTLGNGVEVNVTITLSQLYPVLNEVTVTSQKPYIEFKPDRIILNVQSNTLAIGNSALDILKQAPAVHVDNMGNVSFVGHQNVLITVNGKPTNLHAEDLAGYLQSLQSASIQTIELITSPSAKYEASGGIINIITKKGKNTGTNVTLAVGGGYGTFQKANTSLVFNSRIAKLNIFGSYSYSFDQNFHSILTDRQINYNGLNSDYNSDYYARQKKYSNNFSLGSDYTISENQTLGFLVNGLILNNQFIKSNVLKVSNNGVLDSLIGTTSNPMRRFSDVDYDLNYTNIVDKAGKTISADLSYTNIQRHSTEYITNDFYTAAGNAYRAPLLEQNISPSNIGIWAAKVDYVSPISKTSKLEVGLKYSRAQSDNYLVFGPLVNGQYQSDPNFSNTFLFTENINSAYVNYNSKIGSWALTAGLRAEQTNATGNSVTSAQIVSRSYFDLFPKVQLSRKLDEKNDFTFSYTRDITRPSYVDLNPFLYYLDEYDYTSGNPNLLPEYINKFKLSHTYDKMFITSLYASIESGFYGFNDYEQNDASKVDISTKNNFGTYSVYGFSFSAPVYFTSWWSASFAADASYQRIKAYAQFGNLNKGTQDIQLSNTQTIALSKTMTFEAFGKYESPNFYGIAQFKSEYIVNAAISKQLFNRKGTLALRIDDIFNSLSERTYSNYQNLNLNIVNKVETRIIKVNFSYRFGTSSVKAVKHQTADEDERKRATAAGSGN